MYINFESMINFSKSLIAASSKPLILSILQEGPSYGYKIIQRIKQISNDQMQWADGMLYPVLHKLEKKGFITSEWRVAPETKRKRKYYQITKKGQRHLRQEQANWHTVNMVFRKLWT